MTGDDRVSEGGMFRFTCATCGSVHEGAPSFAYPRPAAAWDVPEDERPERVYLTEDACVVDGETFYIRVVLEIPIHGMDEPFTWGVWVSQSRESFQRYLATFDDDQTGMGSFGWLEVLMPGFARNGLGEPVEFLACDVAWRSPGQRPVVILHESDHPLHAAQRDGISRQQAIDLAMLTLHPDGAA